MTLPIFNEFGLLPPGDYQLTFAELKQSHLVLPSQGFAPDWDQAWRLRLVNNLEILTNQLWEVGIDKTFVDGSFVEDKAHPSDIDGYFECELDFLASGELEFELNKLDPHKVWTWSPESRSSSGNSAKKQLPMWHFYRVELYPHFGQPAGILDEFGNNQMFPAAFRKSRREHRSKGIVQLVR